METFVGWKQTRKFYHNWFKISAWQNEHEVFKKSKVYATNNKNELKNIVCRMRKLILKKKPTKIPFLIFTGTLFMTFQKCINNL